MQSVSVVLYITKVADYPWKNVDVIRTQRVCHVIDTFCRSCLGKV